MDCLWVNKSPSLIKGISMINELDGTKFEQFLSRIVLKLKVQDNEIFTEDERQKLVKIFKVEEESLLMAIKTIIYLFKRMLKFIFMPGNLKTDLILIGFNNEKADCLVKVWSSETRSTLDEFNTEVVNDGVLNFPWKLNAELSSEYHKNCKVPKLYLSFASENDLLDLELARPEVYSMFLQFESIQNDLDKFM